MDRQHTENLFRRYKGQVVKIKTITGSLYQGYVVEVTNDYVALAEREPQQKPQTFVLFTAVEAFIVESAS